MVRVRASISSKMTQHRNSSSDTWLALTKLSEDNSLKSVRKLRHFLTKHWLHKSDKTKFINNLDKNCLVEIIILN